MCNSVSKMKSAQYLTRARVALTVCLIATAACRSGRAPAPPKPITRPASAEEEVTLIRADSVMFDAVVRAQLEAGDNAYPYHLEHLRYDPRPYGTSSGYPEVFAGVQGIDPTLSFPRAGRRAIDRMAANRKRILRVNRVPEGGPLNYEQCAGARVPEPPPPRVRSTRSKVKDVHAGCPRTAEYYLTVGLPIKGQPTGLWNARDTRGSKVSMSGEDVWTTLVDLHSAGPDGWRWSQYAWLFRRDRSGQPLLVSTILIGVVE